MATGGGETEIQRRKNWEIQRRSGGVADNRNPPSRINTADEDVLKQFTDWIDFDIYALHSAGLQLTIYQLTFREI